MPSVHHPPSPLWASLFAGLLACLGGTVTISAVTTDSGLAPLLRTVGAEEVATGLQPLSVPVPPASRGSWIAFTGVGRDGTTATYVISPDGSDVRRVRQGVPLGTIRQWAPDGATLVFCTPPDHATGAASACSEPPSVEPYLRTPSSLKNLDSRPKLSPDGRTLAFVRINDAGTDQAALMTLDIVSGLSNEVVGFDDNVQLGIAWSPDGRLLAYTARPRGRGTTDLWVVAPGDSRRRQVTHLPRGWTASSPAFAPDGTGIAFGLAVGAWSGIAVAGTPGTPFTIAGFHDLVVKDLDWGPRR